MPDPGAGGHQLPRVTQLASGDLWAGAEAQLFALATALRDSGSADVDVILMNQGILAERLAAAGVPVTVLDEHRHSAAVLVRLLRGHIRHRQTDVLHTHRLKENVLGSVAALTVRGVRTMRTVHGAPEHAIRSTDLRRQVQRALDNACARYVQQPIVCVSTPLAATLGRHLPPQRLRVIANGVDVAAVVAAAATDTPLPPTSRRFRIGFFGRLVPVKRLDLVVAIARRLEREAPGTYAFHVFGDGPQREHIAALVREQGLQDVVQMMGFVAETAPSLRQMDVLLLTSDSEGLPMIVLEAMALDVAVVSRDVGELRTVLDDGRAGTLVAGDDPAAFAAAIAERCATTGADERTMRARARVASNYSSLRTASDYAAIYRTLAARR